ncbi:hypothetical protein B0H12DRAFT_1323086 [Mycena haematopus]|nr:hypothetical protein B0H12DRAFT_1323086 [Mycena haematopus]
MASTPTPAGLPQSWSGRFFMKTAIAYKGPITTLLHNAHRVYNYGEGLVRLSAGPEGARPSRKEGGFNASHRPSTGTISSARTIPGVMLVHCAQHDYVFFMTQVTRLRTPLDLRLPVDPGPSPVIILTAVVDQVLVKQEAEAQKVIGIGKVTTDEGERARPAKQNVLTTRRRDDTLIAPAVPQPRRGACVKMHATVSLLFMDRADDGSISLVWYTVTTTSALSLLARPRRFRPFELREVRYLRRLEKEDDSNEALVVLNASRSMHIPIPLVIARTYKAHHTVSDRLVSSSSSSFLVLAFATPRARLLPDPALSSQAPRWRSI